LQTILPCRLRLAQTAGNHVFRLTASYPSFLFGPGPIDKQLSMLFTAMYVAWAWPKIGLSITAFRHGPNDKKVFILFWYHITGSEDRCDSHLYFDILFFFVKRIKSYLF